MNFSDDTLGGWLVQSTALLNKASIGSPRLDCLILLGDILKKDRAWLLAHPEHKLLPEQTDELQNLLNRRATHEPLAYIRGFTEFYGRKFLLNKHVLVPRPESEAIIGLLHKIYSDFGAKNYNFGAKLANLDIADNPLKIADIGTGSGVLGITAVLEAPKDLKTFVTLVDIDSEALKVAKTNVDLLTTGVELIEGDLLDGLDGDYHILLCNLPYVPDEYPINQAAKHEPELALFSGQDGLDHYRKLFSQLDNRLNKPLYLLLESLKQQHDELAQIAAKNGYKLTETQGLAQTYALSV